MYKEKQQSTQPSIEDRQLQQIQDSYYSQMQFGFQVPTNFILDLFQEISTSLNFEMIQKQANHATAIKQINKTFLQMIDCFNWVSEGNMTAIKMTIQTNQKTSKRICKIRGLVGSKRQVRIFIKAFKQKSKQLIKIQNSFYPQEQQEDMQGIQNPFHLQACAIYMFHKILSNDQYGIGSILKNSLNNYKNKFTNIQSSAKLLPLPMKSVVTLIQQIIDNLYKDFNYGKKQMQKVMPYCRVSVQKYVFSQIDHLIIPIYHFAYSQVDNIFEEKRKKIFNTKSLSVILDEVGLPKQLWFVQQSCDFKEIKTIAEWKKLVKYSQGSLQLEKIIHSKTPRQKMKQCQIAYTVLKTLFYEQSQRKKQLVNMQDIIPIMIVVILFTEIQSLKGELHMVLDFVQADPCEMDVEKRMIINFTESFNYIYRDWKI